MPERPRPSASRTRAKFRLRPGVPAKMRYFRKKWRCPIHPRYFRKKWDFHSDCAAFTKFKRPLSKRRYLRKKWLGASPLTRSRSGHGQALLPDPKMSRAKLCCQQSTFFKTKLCWRLLLRDRDSLLEFDTFAKSGQGQVLLPTEHFFQKQALLQNREIGTAKPC